MNKLLLHCCCAPCALGALYRLFAQDAPITLFYYNPCIIDGEYEKRYENLDRVARIYDLPLIDAQFNRGESLRTATAVNRGESLRTATADNNRGESLRTAKADDKRGESLSTATADNRGESLRNATENDKRGESMYTATADKRGESLHAAEISNATRGAFSAAVNDRRGEFLRAVKGHENDSERGERCAICMASRIDYTAKYAAENGYEQFTTTLTTSPYKDAKLIFELGRTAAKRYGVEFVEEDFKKQDGYLRSTELCRKYDIYRQHFCGCEFSMNRGGNA